MVTVQEEIYYFKGNEREDRTISSEGKRETTSLSFPRRRGSSHMYTHKRFCGEMTLRKEELLSWRFILFSTVTITLFYICKITNVCLSFLLFHVGLYKLAPEIVVILLFFVFLLCEPSVLAP